MKFIRTILNLLLILVIGGLGGVLAERVVLPYLIYKFDLNEIKWLKQIKSGATVINKIEKVVITESAAVEEAIERDKAMVVSVAAKRVISTSSKTKLEQILTEGTGFIVTSDGLVATASSLVPLPRGNEQINYHIIRDNQLILARVVKRDLINNLALLKIEESNLPVLSLGNAEEIRLGQKLILMGAEIANTSSKLTKFVNLGVVKDIADGELGTTIEKEKGTMNGGVVLNIKGEAVGLVLVDYLGQVRIASINKIKSLLNN